VYGPASVPAGVLTNPGRSKSDGGGGVVSGPWRMTVLAIVSTASWSGSEVSSTYRSLKNQIVAWTAAAFWLRSVRDTGASVFG
jgi:hypothetical protein